MVLLAAVIDGMEFFGAFDLMLVLVVASRRVLLQHLCPAELPLLLDADLVLDLGTAQDGPRQWIEIGHRRNSPTNPHTHAPVVLIGQQPGPLN